jgi:hypothetical protein
MEQLPRWLQDHYKTLLDAFGEGDHVFSREDAGATLAIPQGTLGEVLSSLERAGHLFREADAIDQRLSIYRLVRIAAARRLNQRLEDWRQEGARTAPPLPEAIDHFWAQCRAALSEEVDLAQAPTQPARLTIQCVAGRAKLDRVCIVKATDLSRLDKTAQGHTSEILKLFDASSNAYRSVTNVLLEYEKLRRDFAAKVYDLSVADYAAIDGMPVKTPVQIRNKALCPICRRFPQSQTALALITGNPKMDSIFQTYRSSQAKRTSIQVCSYCFTAGWVDLPTALITKDGQSVGKGREYLFITTPLAHNDLQRLLDAIARRDLDQVTEEDETEDDAMIAPGPADQEEETESDEFSAAALAQFLKEKYGIEGYDRLAVLGLSRRRLQELRGFVLPSANLIQRVVAVRVPVERLVGEDRVSGAVRRELVKATMYDFWQITGGSLHYNRILNDTPFSVDGQPITREEMRRANVAYRLADRHARVGKYRHLNSGLFMSLLSQPHEAANQILRLTRREQKGRFAPNTQRVKEVIQMVEEIAQRDDWKFQLGLRIVDLLVALDLAPQAGGFWYKDKTTGAFKLYSGVDLVKWLQRLKMARDPDSARAWGTSLINGYRREHDGQGPNTEAVSRILALVEEVIQTCHERNYPLKDFARDVANMDYYLLFYHNQRQAAQKEEAK